MGPAWGPSGPDRTQVGPILAPWTLLSGMHMKVITMIHLNITHYKSKSHPLGDNESLGSSPLVSQICIRVNIGSGNGLLPVQYQNIAWTRAGSLSIGSFAFRNIICEIVAILSRGRWVKLCKLYVIKYPAASRAMLTSGASFTNMV